MHSPGDIVTLTMKDIIDREAKVDSMLEAKIYKYSSNMVLHVSGILGRMISIVPLVRRKQELREYIWKTMLSESSVVGWLKSKCSYDL